MAKTAMATAPGTRGTPYTRPMSDVLELFTELAAIPSPRRVRSAVADRVSTYLAALALEVDEDDAGPRIGSDAGNLLARLPATSPNGGVPIFLCAHLDTVPPTAALEPVVEDGVVRNAGGTILGADNKAAVAAMRLSANPGREPAARRYRAALHAEGGGHRGPRHSTRRALRQPRDSSSTRQHRSAKSFSALRMRVRSRW